MSIMLTELKNMWKFKNVLIDETKKIAKNKI